MLRFLAFGLVPLLAAAWFSFSTLEASLPPTRFTLQDPATGASVSIARDGHGVPYLASSSDTAAFYAVGYVHAQDRLWQLEVQRHMVQGRLGELFGKESVSQDIWFRTLGLYRSAQLAWPALSRQAQASLTAYAAGVNAGMAAQAHLPLEFQLLDVKPAPWTEIDSLAWIKMFAFDLGGNFRKEIAHYVAKQTLPDTQLAPFFPDQQSKTSAAIAGTPSSVGSEHGLRALAAFQDKLERELGLGGRAVGSNAWVVSGRHTADGAALLANDPHLGLQIPSLWYPISVNGTSLHVTGMSLVGLPLVIFGHNDHIAWGGTNMMADTQDLYLEQTDASDANAYMLNGSAQRYLSRTEEIQVRPDFPAALHQAYLPIQVQIRSTRHGPIISDQFHVFDHPVSLRWTALDAGDTSYEAFYRLGFARDWTDFKSALGALVAPAMNLVYADREGNIGSLSAGRIPIRKHGDGAMPSPGWNDDYAWTGFIPSADWPESYNPASGFIVNANNRMVGAEYPHFISLDWASPARAQRIAQLLADKSEGQKRLSLRDMQQIQGDTIDLDARRLMKAIAWFAPQNAEQAGAWAYLTHWDGDMAANSPAAAIFHVWMRHFRKRLFDAPLKHGGTNPAQAEYARHLGDGVDLRGVARLMQRQDANWCADGAGAAPNCYQSMLAGALKAALDELEKRTGERDPAQWQWGALHQTVYAHTPFSHVKPLDKLFEKRISNGGSENAINVAGTQFSPDEGYSQRLGPSFRQTISLHRDRIVHHYMNSTGQSGNVVSAHYADMVEPFRNLQYYPLGTDGAERSVDAARDQAPAESAK